MSEIRIDRGSPPRDLGGLTEPGRDGGDIVTLATEPNVPLSKNNAPGVAA